MRIEVLIGNDDPVVFPLNSSKVSLGTSEQCDVVLNTDGVSRKHIFIITEDDRYFVIDQGSTNGTFINEERLVPGKKTEFTSFFPVRLGDNVLVSLLSDEESYDFASSFKEKSSPNIKVPDNSDKTSVISLKDLNKVKTENLVLARNQKREFKKKNTVKKVEPPPKKTNYVTILIATVFLAVAGYNIYIQSEPEPDEAAAQVGRIVTKKVEQPVVENKPNPNLIAESDLYPKESYNELLFNMRCSIDVEIYLCDLMPGARMDPFGVVQVGLTLHVMLDGTPYFEEAKKYSKPPVDDSPVSLNEYNELILDTGIYLFLLRNNIKLDLTLLGENRLSIALFKQTDQGPKVARVLAILPKMFNEKRKFVKEDNLHFTKSNGISALGITKAFYQTY